MVQFLKEVGGEQEQKEYLRLLKEYRKKRREYVRYWRIKLSANPSNVVRGLLIW